MDRTEHKDGLEHRAVVSSFIIDKSNPDRPRIALFRRSHEVRTYQGKLAPISGSIDPDEPPFCAAKRELREETSLTAPKDLSLHLRGPSFHITDVKVGRRWTVHPFSFILREGCAAHIEIDWEHTGYQWVDPVEILEGKWETETVPRLGESLRRCWLGARSLLDVHVDHELTAGMVLERSLSSLNHDHVSGARQMASNVLEYLKEILGRLQGIPPEERWFQLRFAAWHLIYNGRESMNAAIATALLRCLKLLSPSKALLEDLKIGIDRFQADRMTASGRIAKELVKYLNRISPENGEVPINIMTLSASSTFQAAMVHLLQQPSPSRTVKISILESRPLFEGVSLASQLLSRVSQERVSIQIAPDSSISHLIPPPHGDEDQFTLIVLGADRISVEGDVSNKSGSLPLVSTARQVLTARKEDEQRNCELHVIVLSEVEKIAFEPTNFPREEEENDPTEITKAWDSLSVKGADVLAHAGQLETSKLKVVNKPFEWVPASLIDAYVTDDGVLERHELGKYWQERQQLETEIFGDLSHIRDE